MAKRDYFGLSELVSLILAIIPVTSWVCGIITRIQDGKIIAGIIRIPFGWLTWLVDLFFMITEKHIWRLLNA